MDNSVGLVVARYNEDLSWINEAQVQNPNMTVYIYNKSDIPVEGIYRPYYYERRLNEGNEAETYLYHMLRMLDRRRSASDYDRLTLFVQGRPYDHVHKDHLYRIIRNPETVDKFEWLAYHQLDCKIENECHHRGLPIAPFYKDLMGKDIKSGFTFGVGGMFAVDRQVILNAGYDHISHASNLVLEAYREREPWCILERIWDQVLYVPNAVN